MINIKSHELALAFRDLWWSMVTRDVLKVLRS